MSIEASSFDGATSAAKLATVDGVGVLPVMSRGDWMNAQSLGIRLLSPRYCRNMFFAMNSTFAGRSARRRMKYGYHSVPNGMYTRIP